MIEDNLTWLGIGVGILLVLVALMWGRRVQKINLEDGVAFEQEAHTQTTSIRERIRQIALIEKDEFETFYKPVIDRVHDYEQILSGKLAEQTYFERVYKALRKRRSAIFEYGSSEKDQQKKALWTYALFTTISIRYLVNRLNGFGYRIKGEALNPMLIDRFELANCELSERTIEGGYHSNLTNIHLIEKVLDANIIQRFNHAGVYPFIVNAVTGFYQERINPFYTIIEQVENHIGDNELDETAMFQQNLKLVLELIERNTFPINKANSLIFEGMSYLLVDRNLLWELFRMYAVSSSQPMGKKDFETRLIDVLNLVDFTNNATMFTVRVESNKLDKSQEKLNIKLSNMVALPYKAVSYYRYSDRRRIEKKTLQRDIAVDDAGRGLTEECDVVNTEQDVNRNDTARFPMTSTETVSVKDLFSDQQ